jgi:hypothetical protein
MIVQIPMENSVCNSPTLNEVFHVPNIRANLVFVFLLEKFRTKVPFESNKIIITKNNIFMGKRYCNHRLFVLNVANKMNENVSSSAYLFDSIDLWHARLGHVSLSYLKKMNSLGLISSLNYSSINKYEICVRSDKEDEYVIINYYYEKKGIIHEV